MNRFEILLNKKFDLFKSELESWEDIRKYSAIEDAKQGFRQEYLGEFVKPTCSVSDGKGNYCPSEPKFRFEHNGKEVGLCKDCYLHYLRGHFNSRFQRENYGYTLYHLCV